MASRYLNSEISRLRWLLETTNGYNKIELTSVNTQRVDLYSGNGTDISFHRTYNKITLTCNISYLIRNYWSPSGIFQDIKKSPLFYAESIRRSNSIKTKYRGWQAEMLEGKRKTGSTAQLSSWRAYMTAIEWVEGIALRHSTAHPRHRPPCTPLAWTAATSSSFFEH